MTNKIMMTVAWLLCCGLNINASENADHTYSEESVANLKSYVQGICLAAPIWPSTHKEIPTIHKIVKDGNIPNDKFFRAIVEVAETFLSAQTNGNGKILPTNGYGGHSVIVLMSELGFSEFLPWLEKQGNESQWAGVRQNAAVSYVKIAGLDATPFVQKILSGSEEKYDFNCKYLVTKEFFEQIAKAEASKAPQAKIDAAYTMLIEHAQNASHVSEVTAIDKALCRQLPSYERSIQREAILSRFINSTNETVRANYSQKYIEFSKTPKAECPDLSKRFPSLAEVKLEDEERTEALSATEDK